MLSPESWHGQLNLVYTSNPDGTHGIMVRMQAPLKVQRPLYPEGPKVCHTVIQRYGRLVYPSGLIPSGYCLEIPTSVVSMV